LDTLVAMNSSSFIGRQALANFFHSMATRKAHIANSPPSDPSSSKVNEIFPTLSTLLSVDTYIMDSMLMLCRLAKQWRRETVALNNACQLFIAEMRINSEVTTFFVFNKRQYFIRIGSWNKLRHPPKLPLNYWREKIPVPKLRISGITKAFAESVGRMDMSVAAPIDVESDSDNFKEMGEEVQKSEKGNSSTIDCRVSSMPRNLPDPNKFTLHHSLGVCTNTHMYHLLQEIVKLYGNQSNNWKGKLVVVPSNNWTLEHYKKEMSKPGSVVDAILVIIVESTKSTAENAASCLLSVLFSKFEESFVSVCIEKGLIDGNVDKKMDIIATEAML
jgi:hypothetical protein